MILLDTDHLSLLQWGGDLAGRIERRMSALGVANSFPTSIISYEEQMRGWISVIASAKAIADQIRMYSRLHAQLRFFSTLTIFDFSEKAAVEFQRLGKLKIRIGTMDLKIASISLALGATLFTRNVQDFSKVPGLRIEGATT